MGGGRTPGGGGRDGPGGGGAGPGLLRREGRVSRRAPLRAGALEGVILPVDGGSLAIVGSRGEPLDALERRLRVQFRGRDV